MSFTPSILRYWLIAIIAFGLPFAAAFLLSLSISFGPHFISDNLSFTTVSPDKPTQLAKLFKEKNYTWLPTDKVPLIAVKAMPDNMNALPVDKKKAVFFRALLPLVLAENARIAERRAFLEKVFTTGPAEPNSKTARRVRQIADRYEVNGDLTDPATQEILLRRVDTIPPSLILAQAAIESGWGASRFAQQANNLFGIWTWNADAGLKPRQRADSAEHFVRIYPDIRGSIRGYLHNINVGHAYQELRNRRADMRAKNEPLDALKLAGALENYSARGHAYVIDVRNMITYNDLQQLRDAELAVE
ncbi:MAG TPA: glucosaminidase domain-containing protein [Gammaproteobacteria bacterium]|nr:glucosaminidase domain-containing protein [Gammaproteobacteria bacterium]